MDFSRVHWLSVFLVIATFGVKDSISWKDSDSSSASQDFYNYQEYYAPIYEVPLRRSSYREDRSYYPAPNSYPPQRDLYYSRGENDGRASRYPEPSPLPYNPPKGPVYEPYTPKKTEPKYAPYKPLEPNVNVPYVPSVPEPHKPKKAYPAPGPYSPADPVMPSKPHPSHEPYKPSGSYVPNNRYEPSSYPVPAVPKRTPYPAGPKPDPYPTYPSDRRVYDDKSVPVHKPYSPVPAKSHLPSNLCENCKFINGVGYNPFPESCQAYVTCRRYDGYKLLPTKMRCPYNLFWSQELLTCVRPGDVKCPFDPCLASKGSKTAAIYGNCAAYSVCDGYGRTGSIFCCAYGYRYQAGYGYNKPGYQPCVRDDSCRDTCAPKKTPIVKERCRLYPVKGSSTKYQELVHGSYIVRWCAPGTAFVAKDCGCTARVKIAPKGCTAEVFIDFKYGIKDVSGNFVAIGNEWDRVKSVKSKYSPDGYVGQFHNGQLILWRFANAPLGPPLKIRFNFLENNNQKAGYGGKKEILVSNGDCGNSASVSVSFDRSTQTVKATVATKSMYGKNYKPAHVIVPYASGEYKEVTYHYDGHYLTLTVNSKSSQKSKSVAVQGDVQVRHCSLSIGGVQGETPFYGIFDDFKLFLCAPKTVNPYPPGPVKPYPDGPVKVYPVPVPAPKPYPSGPVYKPSNPDYYPPESRPSGRAPYPAGPAPYPAGPAPYPAGPAPYPSGPISHPVDPVPYPSEPKSYPSGPNPYPSGPSPWTSGPSPYPSGRNPYPAGPAPYPAGPAPYPAGPAPYPTDKKYSDYEPSEQKAYPRPVYK